MKTKILIGLLLFISSQCFAMNSTPSKLTLIKDLKSSNHKKNKMAIYQLHQLGKDAIPILIDEIPNSPPFSFSLLNPSSSFIREELLNGKYFSIPSFYVIELILGRKKLEKEVFFESEFLLGSNTENYIYWDGLIVNDKGKIAEKKDLVAIKSIYQKWWDKNKHRSIEELRKDWQEKKRPLSGSNYHWE